MHLAEREWIRLHRQPWIRLWFFVLILVSASGAAELFDETTTTTVFAFDTVSIPHSQNLRLEMRSSTRHSANPVLQRGAPGTPDAMGVQFYGSILREGGKFRIWYVAFDDDTRNKVASARWRRSEERRVGKECA